MRLPLNEQTLFGYYESINVRPYWQEDRWVSWVGIRGVCEQAECKYTEEHYTFDGQIFYQVEEK